MTTKRKTSRGGGSLDDQMNRLKSAVGREGAKQAQAIVDEYEPDVIKLAFKMVPKGPNVNAGLGKRIETMLANMPKTQADATRASLLAARAKASAS